MREIKFRAWHKKNGMMVYWDDLKNLLYGKKIKIPTPAMMGKGFTDEKDFDYEKRFEYGPNYHLFGSHQFIVEQYTGLKDKNGKEIYEGDIYLRQKKFTEVVGKIDFNCGCCTHVFGWLLHEDIERLEIIGNIHENPKLLEE
jgi:uncharacterized phage protein (TIGR01671 family)